MGCCASYSKSVTPVDEDGRPSKKPRKTPMPLRGQEGPSSLPEKDFEADSRTRVEEQIVADPPGVLAAPEGFLVAWVVFEDWACKAAV
eukprot:s1127_g5.t1